MVDCAYARSELETSPKVEHPDGQWNNTAPSFENTIILFDWDDTLLSSSWLSSRGITLNSDIPKEAEAQLRKLESAVVATLSKALLYGEVHVVTNAEDGWVELSAEKFIPKVVPLLPKLTIVSARTNYECMFPGQPKEWKRVAFETDLEQFFPTKMEYEEKFQALPYRNVISLGDSMYERLALRAVTSKMENTYSKSVKFVERPTIEQLERELSIIGGSFEHMCTYSGNLDLMLVVEMLQT